MVQFMFPGKAATFEFQWRWVSASYICKEDMCQCGCRGWCTLYPLLEMLVVDLISCGDQVHVQQGFAPTDAARAARAGTPLNACAACVFTKGDWPAYCEVAGFRQWGHEIFPCYCCDVTKAALKQITSYEGVDLDGGDWNIYTQDDYLEDVFRCKMVVLIATEHLRDLVFGALRYRKSFLGRGLRKDVPPLGLIKGDRLEPTQTMPDVGLFQFMRPPFQAVFWRMYDNDRVLHESPLFRVPGLSTETHGADALHCWHLGPVLKLVTLVFWFLVHSKSFSTQIADISMEDQVRIGLLILKNKLYDFYKAKRTDDHEWRKRGSEVWNVTQKMMGTKKRKTLAVKAAEARGLLEFAAVILEETVPKLKPAERAQGMLLLESAKAGFRFDQLLKTADPLVTVEGQQELLTVYLRHVQFYKMAGGDLIPKHHMMIHMILSSSVLGHPTLYTTYRDESFNGVIARIARACHRNSFGLEVHRKLNVLQELGKASCTQMH